MQLLSLRAGRGLSAYIFHSLPVVVLMLLDQEQL